ncbi:hypothetical protein ABEB36_003916 [Hypothenemus hampei]|uniref:Sphingomyelin phosphodiesterase n=1 Tax=Hypothenemus hampei TaxID=57062 RepID=A0ABD1F4P3_HYPHA
MWSPQILLLLTSLVNLIVANHHNLLNTVEYELESVKENHLFSQHLNETLQQLQLPHFFRSNNENQYYEESTICSLCYTLVNFLINERRNNISLDVIALEAIGACTLLGIESSEICRGVIDLNLPIFAYIVDTEPTLKGERICDILFQNSIGCNVTTFEWSVDIPNGTTIDRKQPSNPESFFNILHISDFHYDPRYREGKTTACNAPLCCQDDQEDGDTNEGLACGYWSEYNRADSSEALVNETISKAQEFEFEYVYFTGDIISHRVWSTSIENNTRDLKYIFQKMKDSFGKPIFPVVGNHEPSPLNEFALGDEVNATLSSQWLYQLIADEFFEYLDETAKKDILIGGYYSASPRKGLRIIALNSNIAYTENWWLIKNDVDPANQLAWLVKTLKQAENNDEIVHILAHIPSGKSDLMQVWSREYQRIIERFSNTIAAQFNGHTHKDQFMVYYSSSNRTNAINVALNGASVISDKSNPSFKIVNVDQVNFDIIDTQEWTFNLTEANLKRDSIPEWYQLYSFREHFGLSRLIPSEFEKLIMNMTINHQFLSDYHVFKYRNADISTASGCDDNCKKASLCEIVTSQVGDNTQCDYFSEMFDHNM